jgi:hypothetical protein
MASTVSLPGGGKTSFTLPVGADASSALQAAILSEFKAAGKNITLNSVASKAAGKAGFFNAVVNTVTSNVSLSAGTGVQAVFALGTGKDTLVGNTSTSLLYGNASDTKGDSFSVAGKTTVFGTAGADTLSVGTGANATAYLEGGANIVTLVGSDTLTVAGTGTASITGGASGKEVVSLSTGATTIKAGAASISVVGGTGAITFTHGKGGTDTVSTSATSGTFTGALGSTGGDTFNIGLVSSGKFVINSFSGATDKINIVGATAAQIKTALSGAHATLKGGVTTTELTVGTEKITVVGGAVTKTNFT